MERSKKASETAAGNLQRGDGIGQELIEALLQGTPGISPKTIENQLANPKASGDYDRIIREVRDEIEEENRARSARACDRDRPRGRDLLAERGKRGAGAAEIGRALGIATTTYTELLEPYLRALAFVETLSRRVITETGLQYLARLDAVHPQPPGDRP